MVPVMGRVTINGTQSQFSCKKTIPLDMWDVKGNCANGRSKEALQINRELDNIKAQIIKHYQHLSDREAFVTAEMVRNSYQGFGSEYETLLSAFDKDIANQKKRVGKDRAASTLWAMERSRKDVADFIQSHYRRTDMPESVAVSVMSGEIRFFTCPKNPSAVVTSMRVTSSELICFALIFIISDFLFYGIVSNTIV